MLAVAVLAVLARVFLVAAAFLPPVEAQTDATTPWAVLDTRSGSYAFSGPSIVSASGDLYAGNSLVGATTPSKIFGDPSNGWGVASKAGVSSSFAIELGGVYYINVLTVDAAGNLLIGGSARTTGVPITSGAYRATAPGDHAPFVCKLSGADGTPLFCTYLDTTQMDLRALATDGSLDVYILAKATSGAVAPTAGALSVGDRQIVLMKLDATGAKMKFIAEFGGSRGEAPQALALDSSGNAYITGSTISSDFPGTAGSAFPTLPPGNPGAPGTSSFVAKVDPSGANLVWASYGRAYDAATALAVDGSGQVYLAGVLPEPFVRKFSADGSAILWEKTTGVAAASSIAIDSTGSVTVAGATDFVNFPVHNSTSMCPVQDRPSRIAHAGGGVLIRLSPAGDLLQATFLGTRGGVQSMALSSSAPGGYIGLIDSAASSLTAARIGPDVSGKFATALGCVGSAATPGHSLTPAALAPGEIISIFGEGLGPATSSLWTLTPDNRISSSLAGVQVTFDGVPAPLLYVQSSQINAVTPWSLAGKSSTQLCVNYSGKNSCATASVMPAVPTVFTAGAADNYGGAINQDGTLNTAQNPAPAGSVISLFLTGLGPLATAELDGAVTPWPAPSLAYPVQVWFPYPDFHVPMPYTGEVLYAGPAPLAVAGLFQIDVRVPNTPASPFGYPGVPYLWVEVTLPDGSRISSVHVAIAATH